ncbi:MAG TPA: hypothetical protein VMW87_15335, partial [Spirochaetia bacterium]|nr:hypothetical protein [Spirochaetia bacterium]
MPVGATKAQSKTKGAPRWDLTSIYPAFDSAEYAADFKKLSRETGRFLVLAADTSAAVADPEKWLLACIKLHNSTSDLAENLQA